MNRDVPDYGIVLGNPGELKGSTLDLDSRAFTKGDFASTYYDQDALEAVLARVAGHGRPRQ